MVILDEEFSGTTAVNYEEGEGGTREMKSEDQNQLWHLSTMRTYVIVTAFSYIVSALQFPSSPYRIQHRHYTKLNSSTSPLGDASRGNNDIDISDCPLPLNPKGVIFDMDGTLIQHSIDFAEMRHRVYEVADADPIGKDLERTCVLALASQLSIEGQRKTNEIFADIERRALEDMKLMPGGIELLTFLSENNLEVAVLTRNKERNVQHMQQLYLDGMNNVKESLFHPIVARDTVSNASSKEPLKAKPHPDGILHVCSIWGCNPSEVIMVGDSANDDIAAANRASCGGAVLLTQPDGSSLDTDSGYAVGYSEEEMRERTPSLRVESLDELKMYLQVLLNDQRKKSSFIQSGMLKATGNGDFLYTSEQGYTIEIPSIGTKRM